MGKLVVTECHPPDGVVEDPCPHRTPTLREAKPAGDGMTLAYEPASGA